MSGLIVFKEKEIPCAPLLWAFILAKAILKPRWKSCICSSNPMAVKVVGAVTGTRKTPDASLFAGTGKVEEIKLEVQAQNAEIVVFNHS